MSSWPIQSMGMIFHGYGMISCTHFIKPAVENTFLLAIYYLFFRLSKRRKTAYIMLAMFTRSFSEMLNSMLASVLGVQGASNHTVSDFNWILFNAQVRSVIFNICLKCSLLKGRRIYEFDRGKQMVICYFYTVFFP